MLSSILITITTPLFEASFIASTKSLTALSSSSIGPGKSITIDENGVEKDTSSPWIFHELYTVNTIQPVIPERLRKDEQSIECFNESKNKALEFDVTRELSDLQVLYRKDLLTWADWQKGKEKKCRKCFRLFI